MTAFSGVSSSWLSPSTPAAMPDFSGGTAGGAASGGGAAGAMSTASAAFAVFGMFQAGISAYYGAKVAKYQVQSARLEAQSKALSYKYNAEVSELNAKAAEFQIGQVMDARNRTIANQTLKTGMVKSASRASMAARGIQLGVGSTQEVEASIEYAGEVDRLTINANAVRAAEAQRMAAANARANAIMGQVSAQNAIASAPVYAGSSPMAAGLGALFNSSGQVASSLRQNKEFMSWAEKKTKGWWE